MGQKKKTWPVKKDERKKKKKENSLCQRKRERERLITHTTIHPSLGQRLIKQGWEASLLDVGLSKFVRVRRILHACKIKDQLLSYQTNVKISNFYIIKLSIKK